MTIEKIIEDIKEQKNNQKYYDSPKKPDQIYSNLIRAGQKDVYDWIIPKLELAQQTQNKSWININDSLPSLNNGYIDELVLVAVKNKNKEDGIFLYDVSAFDGESWSKRINTWEQIIMWKPIEKIFKG